MTQAVLGKSTLDLNIIRYWINFLHGDSQGLLHVSSTSNWQGRFFGLDNEDDLCAYVTQLDHDQAAGIYLRACTVKAVPRGGGRGSEQDSWSFPGFWADIDIAGPGHKTSQPLPPDETAAREIVREAGLPDPTLWIHSGGGLYPWWLLHTPATLTEGQRTQIRGIFDMLDECLAAAAARLGYHFGTGITDLARVLRLPGTVNRKDPNNPTQCTILEQNGRMYELGELANSFLAAYDRIPRVTREAPQDIQQRQTTPTNGESPFDAFEAATDWADILEPAGWQLAYQRGQTRYWVRPGKHRRDGHSATTGHANDRDRLYVFTTETAFQAGHSYTKGAAYAIIKFNGDMKAAARHLKTQNFGSNGNRPTTTIPDPLNVTIPPPDESDFPLNDTGNAKRLLKYVLGRYLYVELERNWYRYNGTQWEVDRYRSLHNEMENVTGELHQLADQWEENNPKKAEKLRKWAVNSGNASRVNAAIEMLRCQPGVSVPAGSFDQQIHLLNLENGTLDLRDLQFQPHRADDRITKVAKVRYLPEAQAPRFVKFIEEAIPNREMRRYLQRALGYTLLGEADQRCIFLLHGPSGTGKSQLMRIIQLLLAEYGCSAAASTFKVRRGEGVPNDVHELRGKRLVSTSETSADALLDEELVKRLTGNDIITSRGLYQEFQSWRPQCVIWMATNHLPQLNSDDDAIWKRVKPIPMLTVFAGRDDEVSAFAEKILVEEAAGILNWLLEGVAMYRAEGLRNEPAQLTDRVQAYQLESDSVAQFLTDAVEEERLVQDAEGTVASSHLYEMYSRWCRDNGTSPLGLRRMRRRLERMGYESIRSNGTKWRGLRHNMATGVLGSIPL